MKGLLYSSVPDFFKAMEEMNGKDLEGENIEIVFQNPRLVYEMLQMPVMDTMYW